VTHAVALLGPYATGWLDLLLRWLHVIAAIAWIGGSFYFIALDNHLEPPQDERDVAAGVGGEAWEIHGGGFYVVKKFRVAPPRLPERLHWFKWEAYTTWLSGFSLFVVLYYFHARTYLIDPGVADISPRVAVAISVGLLVLAWVVYDVLCRVFERRELVLAVCVAALSIVTAYGVGRLFAPRAAYIQVGAMLGTIMVANVFFNIIPAHHKLIAAKEAGREPDPRPGLQAKQRSVHNNYLTLPVLFAMLSNHFAFTYGHAHAWLVLVALMAIGAWIRHFFNLRHRGRTVWWIPVTAALGLIALGFAIRPDTIPSGATNAAPVPFALVQSIVARRCAFCHSERPKSTAFTTAPMGIRFDTPQQIAAQASAIRQQVVDAKAMPLGNATGMTQAERDTLGTWIRQGAHIR